MTMLRRWVPASLLLSSLVSTSSLAVAQTTPTKPVAPTTTAKPATTAVKPAAAKPATTATAAKPAAPAPDPKAAATPAPDAKPAAPAPDPKAVPTDPKAATTTPVADPEKEAARLFDDAKKSAKASQWDKARELAAAAYKLKSDPTYLLFLAQAEAKTSRARDAAEHLEVFLREAKTATADDKQTAQKLFEDVTTKLGTWYVKVNVEGAEVILNGRNVGRSPLVAPLFVDPGPHEIEVKKEGYAVDKELLAVAPGTESETAVVLKPLPASVKPKKANPDPEVPTPPPPPSPKWRTYGIISGGALTALGLGLGIGLSVSASGLSDEADAQFDDIARTTPTTSGLCGPSGFKPNQGACTTLKETLTSQDSRANGAVAGFVIAGVGAVGTAGLILLPKFSLGRKLMGMKVVPILGIDRVGGTVTGSF